MKLTSTDVKPKIAPRPVVLNGGLSTGSPVSSRDSYSDSIAAWRKELDEFFRIMKSFSRETADTIFMSLAAFSARASEIRGLLIRSDNRQYTAFRTKEIDPFIEEVDRQFKLWSRQLSFMQMEWEASKGY